MSSSDQRFIQQPFRRKQRLLWSILCAICFSYGLADAKAPLDTLTILQITDTHICNLEGYDSTFVTNRQHYGNGVTALRDFFLTKPHELNADAVILTGDNLDFYEAETKSGQLLATQIEQFYPLFASCPVPLLQILGNHDIATYWIDDQLDQKSVQSQVNAARAAWIRNYPCFRNGTYYSRVYDVGKSRYRFIFLDNAYYLNEQSRDNRLDDLQLDWLNVQLKEAKGDYVLIFMHIYLPLGDNNGDGVFFTRNPAPWPTKNDFQNGMLKLLNENPNVLAIIVGHGHRNVIEEFTCPANHRILQVETAGFAQDPNNWRLLKFTEKSVMIYQTGTTVLEKIISPR